MMKLYYCETPGPRKACAVAKYLALPVEFIRVDLAKQANKSPDFLAMNPNGRVPVLDEDGRILWEASAIMCRLAERAGSDLWPDDERRIDIIRWFSWDTAHFYRSAGTLFFENVVKRWLGMGEPNSTVVEEATRSFRFFAGVLSDHLKGRTYLVGDGLTLADFAVATLLPNAEEAKLPLSDYPEIQRWHARLCELPAWREPFPANEAAAA